jgi:Spy/CpxP family protein refolding chaperone
MKQTKTLLVVSLLLACVFVPGFAAADNKAADMSKKADMGVSDNDTSTADNETDETDDAVTPGRSGGAQSVKPYVGVANQLRKQPQAVGPQTARVKQYANTTEQHLSSRHALLNAREQFRNAKTPEEREQLRERLQSRAQEHLLRTIDRMIGRLELLQERIRAAEQQGDVPEGASENIDRYMLRLEGKKLEAKNADTPADIVSAARDIRGEWGEIRSEIARHTRHMLIARIGNYVEKSEKLSDRLGAEIDELADQGVDTTSLEDKLDDFDGKIVCVRTNYILARDALEDGDTDEVGQAVRKANACIRDANRIIRAIFLELREYRAGSVILDGTGTLTAEGSGKAIIRGDIEMQLAVDAGSLSVCDRAGDMAISVTGDGTRTEDGSIVIYTGFNGNATINGSDVVVTMTGTGIELAVEGTGTAVLIGTGSYEVTKDDGDVTSGNWHTPDQSAPELATESETAVESEGDDGNEYSDGSAAEAGNETEDGNESVNTSEEV